jgi:hypothetical protein
LAAFAMEITQVRSPEASSPFAETFACQFNKLRLDFKLLCSGQKVEDSFSNLESRISRPPHGISSAATTVSPIAKAREYSTASKEYIINAGDDKQAK